MEDKDCLQNADCRQNSKSHAISLFCEDKLSVKVRGRYLLIRYESVAQEVVDWSVTEGREVW